MRNRKTKPSCYLVQYGSDSTRSAGDSPHPTLRAAKAEFGRMMKQHPDAKMEIYGVGPGTLYAKYDAFAEVRLWEKGRGDV